MVKSSSVDMKRSCDRLSDEAMAPTPERETPLGARGRPKRRLAAAGRSRGLGMIARVLPLALPLVLGLAVLAYAASGTRTVRAAQRVDVRRAQGRRLPGRRHRHRRRRRGHAARRNRRCPGATDGVHGVAQALTVQIPTTATILKAYLAIYAKHYGGFNPTASDPATRVRLNGTLLTTAGAPVDANADIPAGPNNPSPIPAGTAYRVYDVTTGFGITGSGQYTYEERGDADNKLRTTGDPGMAGAQLVVVFSDPMHGQVRHVTFQPRFVVTLGNQFVGFDVTGLPMCGNAPTNAAISFGVSFECSNEQNGLLQFKLGSAPRRRTRRSPRSWVDATMAPLGTTTRAAAPRTGTRSSPSARSATATPAD